MHIASNGTADGHRIGTAQVLCRNLPKIFSLTLRGQPKMCLCFKGKGLRIGLHETQQYHKSVFVQWQKCAWYDSVLSNKWVVDVASKEILKQEAKNGQRHLLNCDNLSSQTVQTNPQFSKLLGDLCNCDVWNGCAGNTDEIQVVDAGVGALLKRKAEGIQTDWMAEDKNWEEWTGSTLSASRKRILLTHWYGEAWEQVCDSFNFALVFDKCGSSLTADGSEDHLIKLQKLDEFSFELKDAERDPKTGEFPGTTGNTTGEQAADQAEDDDDDEQLEEDIESDSEDEGGKTTDDELEGDDFVCEDGVAVHDECPTGGACVNMIIYYRYDNGWAKGTVKRLVEHSDNRGLNGLFATVFDDGEFFNDLDPVNYGAGKHWVAVV